MRGVRLFVRVYVGRLAGSVRSGGNGYVRDGGLEGRVPIGAIHGLRIAYADVARRRCHFGRRQVSALLRSVGQFWTLRTIQGLRRGKYKLVRQREPAYGDGVKGNPKMSRLE